MHGNPYYGSVVYLLSSEDVRAQEWWANLAKNPDLLIDPGNDRGYRYLDRTTASLPGNRFLFSQVQPGKYYVYSPVFWSMSTSSPASPESISTQVYGSSRVAAITVVARETVNVTLRRPERVFGLHPSNTNPGAFRIPPEYVYTELPEVLRQVEPEYPAEALRAGVQGTVMLQVLVGADGKVQETRILKSIPMLDSAAVAVVDHWTFKPALRKKIAMTLWLDVPVQFMLPSRKQSQGPTYTP